MSEVCPLPFQAIPYIKMEGGLGGGGPHNFHKMSLCNNAGLVELCCHGLVGTSPLV